MNFSQIVNLQEYYVFAIIAGILTIVYLVIGRAIKHSRMNNDQIRRTISNLRTAFLFILLVSFLILWAKELYQFVLSIAAIGAALAIALKEVFLCFGGSFYRTFAHPFSIGDRIQINEIRGDVVDVGLLGTQILEVGPKDYTHQFTGRMISIPNSLFLTNTVYNETDDIHNDDDDFSLHVFKVPILNDSSWEKHRDTLLECAEEVCNPYMEQANTYFKKVAKKRHVDIPWIEPRINIKFQSTNHLDLIVRVTVPVALKGTVEQKIIRNYLGSIHS